MALHFDTKLSTYTWGVDIRFQDAAATLTDAGGDSATWTEDGTILYRDGSYSNAFVDDSVDTRYWANTNGTDDGWHSENFNFNRSTGSILIVVSDDGTGAYFGASGVSGGTSTYWMKFENKAGVSPLDQFSLTLYGAGGAGVDETSIVWEWHPLMATGMPQIIMLTQDGTGIRCFCNGIEMQVASSTVTDASMWLHTLHGNVDGLALAGVPVYTSGPVYDSLTDEITADWAFFGVTDTVLTPADHAEINNSRAGDGLLENALTVSGRNQYRRYWTNQSRGTTPKTGLEGVGFVFLPSGSSGTKYHEILVNAGSGIFMNFADDTYIAEPYQFEGNGETEWSTIVTGVQLNPNGNVMFGGSKSSGTSYPKVPMYWKDNHWNLATYDTMSGIYTPNWGLAVWHPDGDLVAATGTRQTGQDPTNPFLYKWDGAGDFSDETGRFDQTDIRASIVTEKGVDFSPDGEWFAAACGGNSPYNTVTTAPIHLWRISTVSTDKDTFTWETPYTSADLAFNGAYSCHFVTNSAGDLFLFVSQYSPTAASLQYVVYEYDGAGTWSKNNNIFNNAVAPTNFSANTQGYSSLVSIGDDIYFGGGAVGTTTYQNLFHLRWNGTYFDEQTDPVWPHEQDAPQVAVPVFGMTATPDGAALIVSTSNAGAADIPCILAYDRNTTTGALTLRDTNWDFWDIEDAVSGSIYTPRGNSSYVNQNHYAPQAFASWPPADAF